MVSRWFQSVVSVRGFSGVAVGGVSRWIYPRHQFAMLCGVNCWGELSGWSPRLPRRARQIASLYERTLDMRLWIFWETFGLETRSIFRMYFLLPTWRRGQLQLSLYWAMWCFPHNYLFHHQPNHCLIHRQHNQLSVGDRSPFSEIRLEQIWMWRYWFHGASLPPYWVQEGSLSDRIRYRFSDGKL